MSTGVHPKQLNLNLEKHQLDIGIVALTDCAPLVVAKHLGFFEQWGLEVNLHTQYSWATIRDRLQANFLDAAQMLAPMPLASSLGLNGPRFDIITAFNLSMNGNGITLSTELINEIKSVNDGTLPNFPLESLWLKQVIEKRIAAGQAKLKFAAVYPFSCHYYQMRDWLTNAGIDCDNDIEVLIIPPANMTDAMTKGDIDAFCVGTPWNAKAVRANLGCTVITSNDIWQDAPEKVLAVSVEWQQKHPNTFLALMAAVQQACYWLRSHVNRFETALLLQPYLNEPIEVIAPSLMGSCLTGNGLSPREVPAYNRFVSDSANQPSKSQGANLLQKMRDAGQLADLSDTDTQRALNLVYREDIYEEMLGLMNQLSDIAG